jgi:hypothetical protein
MSDMDHDLPSAKGVSGRFFPGCLIHLLDITTERFKIILLKSEVQIIEFQMNAFATKASE